MELSKLARCWAGRSDINMEVEVESFWKTDEGSSSEREEEKNRVQCFSSDD